MPQRKIDNSEAFFALSWIISDADKGFYIITAPSHMQKDIAKRYKTQRVVEYDFSQNNEGYSYEALSVWADEQPEGTDVLFLLNMQTALRDEKAMAAFNMSRDLLAKKKKIWFFFMDKGLEYQLSTFAYDVYAYVRQKIHFEAELNEEFEGKQLLEFDGRHNISRTQETLKRNKDLEERYMSLPIEGTSSNQLLSAAMALTNMARLYDDCAEYDDALRLLLKVKVIRERVLEEGHPDIAETYNNTAFVYESKGEYSKALKWYQQALEIAKMTLGEGHPDVAIIYGNIAWIYTLQGDYGKALELCQDALEILEKTLGKGHLKTAAMYNTTAHVYSMQGNYCKALELFQQALSIREKAFGREHTETVAVYNNIASVYYDQDDYSKALELFQQTLGISENVQGKEHPRTAQIYNNIAFVYLGQGDYSKALEYIQKAYDILFRRLGENHPDTIKAQHSMQLIIVFKSKNR